MFDMRFKSALLPILFFMAVSGVARAEPEMGVREALQFCSRISHNADRLACFDELVETAGWGVESVADASADDEAGKKQAVRPAEQEDDAPSRQAASQEDVDAAPRFFRLTTEDSKPKEKQKRTAYSSVVVTAWHNPLGEVMAALENGEIWRQNDSNPSALPDPGDTVTLTPAVFGSWKMKYRNVRAIRVRLVSDD